MKTNPFAVSHKSMDQLPASLYPTLHSIHKILFKYKITFGIIHNVFLNIRKDIQTNMSNDMTIIRFNQAQNTKNI